MFAYDTNALTRKWSKTINLVESVQGQKLTAEKKSALVHALENTSRRVAYKEATNPGNIGQYKKYAVDLVTAVIPNLIAFDVAAVQPMDNKSGMINYFNYNYSNTKGTVKAGDTFNSSLNMGPSNEFYSSGLVKDHPVKLDANGEAVLNWTPVKVGTFSVATADGKYATTDRFGNLVSEDGITGLVTPAGTLKVEGQANVDVTVTYKFDNTSVEQDGYTAAGFTNAPSVELEIKSVPVNAETRTLRAYWALTQRQAPRCSDAA